MADFPAKGREIVEAIKQVKYLRKKRAVRKTETLPAFFGADVSRQNDRNKDEFCLTASSGANPVNIVIFTQNNTILFLINNLLN
ncbi:MAG: hypothetical protein WB502_06570 [Thermoactinomyces sp.]